MSVSTLCAWLITGLAIGFGIPSWILAQRIPTLDYIEEVVIPPFEAPSRFPWDCRQD